MCVCVCVRIYNCEILNDKIFFFFFTIKTQNSRFYNQEEFTTILMSKSEFCENLRFYDKTLFYKNKKVARY